MRTPLHRSDFLREAKTLFPSLKEDLNKQYGLPHLEMHAFCDFVQTAIDQGDRSTVAQAFNFSARLLAEGNSQLVNALTVSMLEHLNFEDGKVQRSWAQVLMPQTLAAQYRVIVEYNQRSRELKGPGSI